MVVAGSGEGSCTAAAYYSWVLLRRYYCPLLPIGGRQKTLQRSVLRLQEGLFSLLSCLSVCLSQAFLKVGFLSDAHGRVSACDMASIPRPLL